MLDDRFQADDRQILESRIAAGASAESVATRRSLSEQIRKGHARQALDIICKHRDPCDLNRVRNLIRDEFVSLSVADLEYLKRNGEWSDIVLIIEAAENRSFDLTLLTSDEARYRAAAETIYRLGRDRLEELLGLPMPSQLMAQLIGAIADAKFRSLSDECLLTALRAESSLVRKIAALKCVRLLSRERLTRMLDAYTSEGNQYYYNVVHWLDFGISTPRDRAVCVGSELRSILGVSETPDI
jgi:hypothetical protein